MARPGEDDLIARYFAPLATTPGADGLRDDVAVLPRAGGQVIVTTDMLVAGVHFFADDAADDIARKALRVNLSDLAAKGAQPLGFVLNLALPADWTEPWLAVFARGLGEDVAQFGCPLLGGDTVRSAAGLTLAITAFGEVAGSVPRRHGARAGDDIYVSGSIGDGALGLRVRRGELSGLPDEAMRHLLDRYLRPRPRLSLAPLVAAHASASMDVSDGLAGDLAKLLATSGLAGVVDLAAVPLSPAARAALELDPSLQAVALGGGDDYEILFTAPVADADAIARESAAAGCPVTRIGRTSAGQDLQFVGADGREHNFPDSRFSHF